MKRIMILLLCLALPMAWAESGPAALANEVNAKQGWADDLEKCPADLFAATNQQTYNHAVREQCTAVSGQAACIAACRSGKGEYCYWLANALQTTAPDDKASEILFQRSCKLGVASGCTNRAAAMMKETEGAKSCPARTFRRTCAANDAWGCAMYGFILSRDKSDPRNKQRALEVLENACQYGEEDPACRSATALRRDLQR